MDLGLEGRSALIAGASREIGSAIATVLAEEGCSPLHIMSRNGVTRRKLADTLARGHGVEVMAHPFDLALRSSTDALGRICADVDILVNSAGAIPRGALDEIEDEEWRRSWDVKVFGCIDMTREIYPRMRERRRGVILNVVGNAGERPNSGYIAAGSANAALIYFTEALGGDSLKYGVRVVGVNPGPVLTGRFLSGVEQRAQRDLGDRSRLQENFAELPLGRPAEPSEVASLVAYLVSNKASYISGVLVRVDGGLSSRPPALWEGLDHGGAKLVEEESG